MYAKYIKREIPDLNGTGRTQAYYQMELKPMSFESFVSQCAREGNMEESQILAVMSLVSEKLALCMAEGFSVKLDGIGTFNAKLGVRSDMLQDAFEPGEPSHNAKSIGVTGVAYRADKDLIRTTRHKCVLERGGVSRIKKSKFTLEERIEKARDFLQKNMFMRVPDYMRLTGLSRTTASQELRKLALNPSTGITSRGREARNTMCCDELTDFLLAQKGRSIGLPFMLDEIVIVRNSITVWMDDVVVFGVKLTLCKKSVGRECKL